MQSLILFSRLAAKRNSGRSTALAVNPFNACFWKSPAEPAAFSEEIGQVRYRSNRSRRGLYNGKDIRAGNSLSFSMKANKRKFKPNVFLKRVYSETLDEMIRFHLTASTLRTIDKAGGLDNYLLTSKFVTEGEGYEAKKRILRMMKDNAKKEGRTNTMSN